jgi:hypothetical protein
LQRLYVGGAGCGTGYFEIHDNAAQTPNVGAMEKLFRFYKRGSKWMSAIVFALKSFIL